MKRIEYLARQGDRGAQAELERLEWRRTGISLAKGDGEGWRLPEARRTGDGEGYGDGTSWGGCYGDVLPDGFGDGTGGDQTYDSGDGAGDGDALFGNAFGDGGDIIIPF